MPILPQNTGWRNSPQHEHLFTTYLVELSLIFSSSNTSCITLHTRNFAIFNGWNRQKNYVEIFLKLSKHMFSSDKFQQFETIEISIFLKINKEVWMHSFTWSKFNNLIQNINMNTIVQFQIELHLYIYIYLKAEA